MMLVVIRSKDCLTRDGVEIGCNSMGYAGSLGGKEEQQIQMIKKMGPTNVLKELSVPRLTK